MSDDSTIHQRRRGPGQRPHQVPVHADAIAHASALSQVDNRPAVAAVAVCLRPAAPSKRAPLLYQQNIFQVMRYQEEQGSAWVAGRDSTLWADDLGEALMQDVKLNHRTHRSWLAR